MEEPPPARCAVSDDLLSKINATSGMPLIEYIKMTAIHYLSVRSRILRTYETIKLMSQ